MKILLSAFATLLGLMLFLFPLLAKPTFAPDASTTYELKITVVNSKKKSPIEKVDILLTNLNGISQAIETNKDITYFAQLPCDAAYLLQVSHPDYEPFDTIIEAQKHDCQDFELAIELKPIAKCSWPTNIYFSEFKSELRPESKVLLDGLYQVLMENPELGFSFLGYTSPNETDTRPDLAYKRADEARDYLVKLGIEAHRVTAKSGGYSPKLIENNFSIYKKGASINEAYINSLPDSLKEEAEQLNRRVSYEVFAPKKCEFKAKVIDAKTKEAIVGSQISLVGTDGSAQEVDTDTNGEVTLNCNCHHSYVVTASHKYHLSKTGKITWFNKPHHPISQTFELPYYQSCRGMLPYIYFDRFKEALRDSTIKSSLDGLVQTLNENPSITIKITAYLDYHELAKKPQLALKRANEIRNYLIDQGIDDERLVAENGGYRPRIIDHSTAEFDYNIELNQQYIEDLGATLQEKAHQLNRRAEFTVLRRDFNSYR